MKTATPKTFRPATPVELAAEHSPRAVAAVKRLMARGVEIDNVWVLDWFDTGVTYRPAGRSKNWTHRIMARRCIVEAYDPQTDTEIGIEIGITRLGRNGTIRNAEITVGAIVRVRDDLIVATENTAATAARRALGMS